MQQENTPTGYGNRVIEIEGRVIEHGSWQSEGPDIFAYSFIVVEKADGTKVKVNDAVLNLHQSQEVEIGRHAAFYVRPLRNRDTATGHLNVVVATESDRGQHFYSFLKETPVLIFYLIAAFLMLPLISLALLGAAGYAIAGMAGGAFLTFLPSMLALWAVAARLRFWLDAARVRSVLKSRAYRRQRSGHTPMFQNI